MLAATAVDKGKRAANIAEWEQHKQSIEDLYITENLSLQDVMEAMAEKHSFKRSKAQYEGTLKKWGFRKNMSKGGWKHALHCVAKRTSQNKQSMVKVGGRLRTEKSIAKARHRYSYQTFAERLDALQSLPPRTLMTWTAQFEPEITRNSTALLMNENHTKYHAEIRQLSSFLPFDPDGNGQISRIPTNTPYLEFLTGLYKLSNNMTTDIGNHVQRLLKICRSKDRLNFLRGLLTSRNYTIMAAAEKLLIHAVYANDESLTKILLNAGTNPDGVFPMDCKFGSYSVLEVAVTGGYKNLASMLIGAGARFDPFTLLFVALYGNFDIEIVKLILQHPVPDHEIPRWNKYFAAKLVGVHTDSWSVGLVDLLLVYISKTTGIDHKEVVKGLLPVAVKSGKTEIIQYLLSFGARLHLNHETMIEELLHVAVATGKQDLVSYLLSLGADINFANPEQKTPLESAVHMNRISMVELLVLHGAGLNRKQRGNRQLPTALQIAAQNGNLYLVNLMLKHGAHVNAEPFDSVKFTGKITTLQSGVKGGNIAVVEMLLKAGASLDASPLGVKMQTALEIACASGSDDMIYLLLSYGAKVNAATKSLLVKHTPLTRAITRRRKNIIDLLLERGADVNIPSKDDTFPSPLQVCVAGGDIDMVKRLLDLGAHPYDSGALWAAAYTGSLPILRLLLRHNEKFVNFHLDDSQVNRNDYGRVAISTAILKRDYESTRLLLEAGVDVTCSPEIGFFGSFNGNNMVIHSTTLMALAAAISEMDIYWVRVLLDAGADVNVCLGEDLDGLDCIFDHLELTSPNIEEMVELLIASGAPINHCKSTFPPLHRAVSEDLPAMVRLFLLKGAHINLLPTQNRGRTALQNAAEEDSVDMVVFLIESGADTNAHPAAYSGATAIQFAAMNGNFEILQLLLAAGANLFAPRGTWNGRTALEGAAEHGRLYMVQFILKKSIEMEGLYTEHQLCRASKYARKSGHIVLAQMIESHQVERYGSSGCCGHESVFVLGSDYYGDLERIKQLQAAFPSRFFDSDFYEEKVDLADFVSSSDDDSEEFGSTDQDSGSIASPSAPANDQESSIQNQDIIDAVSPAAMEGVQWTPSVHFHNAWHPEEPHAQQGYPHGYDEMLMVPPFDNDQIVPEATSPGFISEELF
ncbi:ankyrin repeat protein [Rutstroemia sp. NJR-2017a WRK4]|nr:ankyrin repeat protein [Rutstroemia sp. NJR-2017a WRK4]